MVRGIHVQTHIVDLHLDPHARHVNIHLQLHMSVIEMQSVQRAYRNPVGAHDQIVLRLPRDPIMLQHHGVPVLGFLAGRWMGGLDIVRVSLVVPHLAHITGVPARRAAGNSAKSDFREEIRPIPGAQMHHVLHAALFFIRRLRAYSCH